MFYDVGFQMTFADEKLATARDEVRRLRIKRDETRDSAGHRHRPALEAFDTAILRVSRGAARRKAEHAAWHAAPQGTRSSCSQ